MIQKLNVIQVLFFALIFSEISAQTYILNGIVSDTLLAPLPFTNIIANPQQSNLQMAFAISDEQGRYKLILNGNETYKVMVSYIGFDSQHFELKLASNSTKNIQLKTDTDQLNEVTLNHKTPVRIKKDTIVFDAKFFATGTERKLKDLLEKLPGVEVDKEGSVSIAGKKVNKLLVEGKEFFGGQTKMGIENIPANAVDEIEMLDNYSPVSFLKELNNSDILAMNIKLKKDKKQFTFGDVDVGVATKKQYLINPKVFYYSPNKTYNFIGDVNDIGIKSFTLSDYLNYEGGIVKMMENPSSYFKLARNEMANFLENQDYKSSKNRFGAFHYTQQFNEKLKVNSYALFSNTETDTQTENNNLYLSETFAITENKKATSLLNTTFLMLKATVDYKPSNYEDLSYTTFFKSSNNGNNQTLTINSLNKTNQLRMINKDDEITLKQNAEWHKRFSKKQTTSLSFFYEYKKNKPQTNWITDMDMIQGLIPVLQESEYNLQQYKSSESNLLNLNFKHYWVINNSNHIYTSVGYLFNATNYRTDDFQILADETINNFNLNGFGNNLDYNFNDTYFGINYKIKSGILTVNSGVFGHYYNWQINQNMNSNKNKWIWLPELLATFEFNKSEKINFKYNLKSTVADASKYANQYQLQRYNSIYRGNEHLENELYHTARLWYTKFSMYRGIIMNFNIGYQKKMNSIKNEIQRIGLNQFITPIFSDKPETSWTFSANVDKKIGKLTAKIRGNRQLLNYEQTINSKILKNESSIQSIGLFLETKFKEWPNIEVGYNNRYSQFNSENYTSTSRFIEPVIKLEYAFLDGFILKADYTHTDYKNNSFHEQFNLGNTSLFYQHKKSAWGFKLSGSNILGVDFKNQNTFSDFIISDTKTYILPRIVMISVSYKI